MVFCSLTLENHHFLILLFRPTVGQEVEVLRRCFHRGDQLSFPRHPSGTAGEPRRLQPSFPSIISVPALPLTPGSHGALQGPNVQKRRTPASLRWEIIIIIQRCSRRQIKHARSVVVVCFRHMQPRPCGVRLFSIHGVRREALSPLSAVDTGRIFSRQGSQVKARGHLRSSDSALRGGATP